MTEGTRVGPGRPVRGYGATERPGPPSAPGQTVRLDRPDRRAGHRPARVFAVLVLAGATSVAAVGVRAGWALGLASFAVVLGGGLALLTLLTRRLLAVTVRGVSMQPAFHDGDRVLVRRTTTPKVGQVVLVEQPARDGRWPVPALPRAAGPAQVASRRWMIKRVVAVPGDPVPLVAAPGVVAGGRVPPGRLVLLGDNRLASLDSRQLGYFPVERTLGTVLRRLGRGGSDGSGVVGGEGPATEVAAADPATGMS